MARRAGPPASRDERMWPALLLAGLLLVALSIGLGLALYA